MNAEVDFRMGEIATAFPSKIAKQSGGLGKGGRVLSNRRQGVQERLIRIGQGQRYFRRQERFWVCHATNCGAIAVPKVPDWWTSGNFLTAVFCDAACGAGPDQS